MCPETSEEARGRYCVAAEDPSRHRRQRMRKQWVGQVYGSASRHKKAGTLILIHKKIMCTTHNIKADEAGRMVTVTLSIGDRRFSITNIYAPNQQTKDTSRQIADWIMAIPDKFHLVGGDFNDVMMTQVDRRSKPNEQRRDRELTGGPTRLATLMDTVALTDIWRLHNPTGREYTHLSQIHGSLSRIDYIFGTEYMIAHLNKPSIEEIAVSNNAPVGVEYPLLSAMGRDKLWRFPDHLVGNQELKTFLIDS